MTTQPIKDTGWEVEFIHRFCNDHNGEVRFLRSVFYDEKDGAEEIMGFITSAIETAREEAVREKEIALNKLYSETEEDKPPMTLSKAESNWNSGFQSGRLKSLEDVSQRVFGKDGDDLLNELTKERDG